MKEFISILISFIFMGIANSLDSAFNNAVSIDAIVVCGSLFSIDLILKSISEIGTYTYRVERKDESSYLLVNAIVSFILGIVVFLSRNYIVNIFDLTVIQKEMLSNILFLYIGYLILGRVSNAMFEMIRLKGELKLYRHSLIVYYVFLIFLDAIAYFFTKNLVFLFLATMVSCIISIIYMLINLKLDFKIPNKDTIQSIVKYGIPTSLERLLSRIFILIYGVIASNLETDKYSIHTICYSVCLSLEIITNAYQVTLMIKVPTKENYIKQYESVMQIKNKCYLLVLLLNYVFCFIYLFITHGSLPLEKCFPYIIFYSFSVFGLYQYETYKTLCIVQRKPTILLIGSTVGVIIRVALCLCFYNTEIALFIFGISNFIDFYIRSIVYRVGLKKIVREEN